MRLHLVVPAEALAEVPFEPATGVGIVVDDGQDRLR
jgi:hypothetical protein